VEGRSIHAEIGKKADQSPGKSEIIFTAPTPHSSPAAPQIFPPYVSAPEDYPGKRELHPITFPIYVKA